MRKLSLADAKPGMFLAKAATRKDGMVIVPEGAELTQSMLDRLDSQGATHLFVKGDDQSICTEGEVEVYTERLARLDYLFRSHVGDAWMDEVKAYLRASLEHRIAACGPAPDAPGAHAAQDVKDAKEVEPA